MSSSYSLLRTSVPMLVCFLCLSYSANSAELRSPVAPKLSLQYLKIHPAVEVELVACEPNVVDPVAIRFDETGRLWVVEMRDYPLGPAAGQQPQSRIRILRDRDDDGFYESAATFAEGLLFPTGLQPWRDGVIVTLSGKIVYMADTNGDDKVDHQETWYEGFAEQNTQLRANHPLLGIDNQVYIANGLRGGEVRDVRNNKTAPISLRGYDFRFSPHKLTHEGITGMGQFGLTFDDYGNRFICSNRNPAKQIVIEDRYVNRNRSVAISATTHDVAQAGEASRVFPLVQAWTTSNLHAGQFTAACGVTVYRGTQLPQQFFGNLFTCEPTGSLVHREVIHSRGSTFQSKPGRGGIEFLASLDPWFRPVNLAGGPDGALYVVDMYRAVIEHPQFVPIELKDRPDQRYGDDLGRIYRIREKKKLSPGSTTQLATASSEELVKHLADENVWIRETAARLLLQQDRQAALAPLKSTLTKSISPLARLHSLWLLDGLDALTAKEIAGALADPHPGVRRSALIVAESRVLAFPQETPTEFRTKMLQLLNDDDPAVRFQAILSVTPIVNNNETQLLSRAIIRSASDPWTVRAGSLASGNQSLQLFKSLADYERDLPIDCLRQFATIAAKATPDSWLEVAKTAFQMEGLSKFTAVLNGAIAGSRDRSHQFAKSLSQAEYRKFDSRLDESVALLNSAESPLAERLAALHMISLRTDREKVILDVLQPGFHYDLQAAAVRALATADLPAEWKVLATTIPARGPQVRRAMVEAMIGVPRLSLLLLTAFESESLPVTILEPHQVKRLQAQKDKELKARWGKVLATLIPADREVALKRLLPALSLKSDPNAGIEIFKKRCSTCHRIGGIGTQVGSNISDTRTKTPQQLLTDIIQPSRAVDAAFLSYTVITDDGKIYNGVLESENAAAITLVMAEGKKVVLSRDELEVIRCNGVSLMPDGLERDLTPQQMADLISFLKNWRYLDGQVPLRESILPEKK